MNECNECGEEFKATEWKCPFCGSENFRPIIDGLDGDEEEDDEDFQPRQG